MKQILEQEYDEAAVRAASEEIADQIQTAALTLSTAVGEVRDVLTDEQIAKLETMKKKAIARHEQRLGAMVEIIDTLKDGSRSVTMQHWAGVERIRVRPVCWNECIRGYHR
ncbi:MAG: hypothetical protein O2923_00625 [Verrucomicrobia bacterium]|nr:hypothetical protein [Verrucomicrobiota bacterium]MDA1086013.1 hypothetical protein [Verrucomicrobiota bacterium]